MKFCPECGKEIKDTMRFCINCGTDLNKHRENEARRKAAQFAETAREPQQETPSPAEPSPFAAFTESAPAAEGTDPFFPAAPAYPAVPDAPEEAVTIPAPVELVIPEAPEAPAEPEKPEEPSEAGIPEVPEIPEASEAPKESEEPLEPGEPETPATPADTEETEEPKEPQELEETAVPEVPEESEETAMPEVPEEPETPSAAEPSAPAPYTPIYKEAILRARDHFLWSDARFALPAGSFDFHDDLSGELENMRKIQLLDTTLWKKFVSLFRHPGIDDADFGWRCEYWGKMMRGACFTYACSPVPDDELYGVLEASVRDMLSAQDSLGRFSTYSVKAEFNGWDLWGRKYILLGFLYFLDICRDDELADTIVAALIRHADYMVDRLGREEEGKRVIAACTSHWDGLNSCSILEPFVMLYNITHDPRYFAFAEYIVSFGGTLHQNLFDLAYEDKIPVHEYSITKAYEMISCFEGLAEFAKVTGNERYREAVIRFGRRILREEATVIGCLGCDYESFDHAAAEQFNGAHRGIMQETCVTATWMKFCWQLWRMTGDNAFLDALEVSAYNAMSASLRRHAAPEDNGGVTIPVHSYNPLRREIRYETVGGRKNIDEHSYYGCCVCISTLGFALDTLAAAGTDREGTLFVNLFRNGTIRLEDLVLTMETDYPKSGVVRVTADGFEGERTLVFRIPGWAKTASAVMGGVTVEGLKDSLTLTVTPGASFTLRFDMPVVFTHPADVCDTPTDVTNYLSVRRGPVVFALDDRDDDAEPVPLDECRLPRIADPGESAVPARQVLAVKTKGGPAAFLIDYASAGQEHGHTVSAWIRTE